MSKLTKEEFMHALKTRIGDGTTDDICPTHVGMNRSILEVLMKYL